MQKQNFWRFMGLVAVIGAVGGGLAPRLHAVPHVMGLKDGEAAPAVFSLAARAPKGAFVLISGKPEEMKANWYKRRSTDPAPWTYDEHGATLPSTSPKVDITSKQEFGDCYVHAEFRSLTGPDGKVLGGGNSGVGLMGRYEVQILNSYGRPVESHECGALYSQKAPLVNACKPGGEWQTYDIIFRTPRFDNAGKVIEQARATVFQNGILVQNNEEFKGPTGIQYEVYKSEAKTGPLVLQGDHDPVQFRNVWVAPL